jgi:hypothetical protein
MKTYLVARGRPASALMVGSGTRRDVPSRACDDQGQGRESSRWDYEVRHLRQHCVPGIFLARHAIM